MQHHSLTLLALLASATSFAAIVKRDLNPPSTLPGGWQYFGCYTDSVSDRTLASVRITDANMTDEKCINFCSTKGYVWAGTEYSTECYCGAVIKSGSTFDPQGCTMACGGDSAEPCGAGNRLSVFTNNGAGPQNKAAVNGYQYRGCYSDKVGDRTLTKLVSNSQTSSSMTIEVCTSACKSTGFAYAGVEYGGECFCGSALGSSAQLQVGNPADTGCDMVCNGDATEWCGGPNRINVYSNGASSPTTSTTSSTTTSSTPVATASQQLYCTGFEGCSWTAASQDGLGIFYQQSSTLPHSGSTYLSITASQSSGASGDRSACVETYPYIASTGNYNLSFYIGGINNFRQDPRCAPNCIPPQYDFTWTATLAGYSYSGVPCESRCSVNDVGGQKQYDYFTQTLKINEGYQTLRICADINGIRRGQDDVFLLDDVSLIGPY